VLSADHLAPFRERAEDGLDPHQVPAAVRDLCEDTVAQIGSGNGPRPGSGEGR
jgi:hypothetical protein